MSNCKLVHSLELLLQLMGDSYHLLFFSLQVLVHWFSDKCFLFLFYGFSVDRFSLDRFAVESLTSLYSCVLNYCASELISFNRLLIFSPLLIMNQLI